MARPYAVLAPHTPRLAAPTFPDPAALSFPALILKPIMRANFQAAAGGGRRRLT